MINKHEKTSELVLTGKMSAFLAESCHGDWTTIERGAEVCVKKDKICYCCIFIRLVWCHDNLYYMLQFQAPIEEMVNLKETSATWTPFSDHWKSTVDSPQQYQNFHHPVTQCTLSALKASLRYLNSVRVENFPDTSVPPPEVQVLLHWHEDIPDFILPIEKHPEVINCCKLKLLPAAVQMEHWPHCFHWFCLHFPSLNKLQHHTVSVSNWHNKWYFSPTQLYW